MKLMVWRMSKSFQWGDAKVYTADRSA